MKTLLTLGLAMVSLIVSAQTAKKSVVVGSMTSRPNALLIVNPPEANQGVLLPQLTTTQRMSMQPASPGEDGLIVFDKDLRVYYYWSAGAWTRLRADGTETRYAAIDPSSFKELKRNDMRHDKLVLFDSDNTFMTVRPDGIREQVIAPISLPHGAVIQELTVYYMDNDVRNLRIYLLRKTFTGTNDEIFSWESAGASQAIRSESFVNFSGKATIDLEQYTYRLLVQFDVDDDADINDPADAKQRIYGVKIKYQQ